MRISQARRSSSSAAGRSGRAGSSRGGNFQLPGARGAVQRHEISGPSPVSSIDTILALQGIEEPSQRRRNAVESGGRILDLLDRLKVSLLSGRVPAGDLNALKKAIERQPGLEHDPELNDVLKQIDLRARVEIAKLKGNAA